jgi:pimeloyl-ACP methyl ester carboxylesterase
MLGGCREQARSVSPEVLKHVIAVDSDGIAGDPISHTQTARSTAAYDFDGQLKEIFAAMDGEHKRIDAFKAQRRFAATGSAGAAAPTTRPVRRVLLFVHGGMNEPDDALQSAVNESRAMADEHADFFPIFINWNSGLQSSYGEHLVDVRRGRKDHKNLVLTRAIAPFVFLADLGSAIGRAPLLWLYQIERDLQAGASDVLLLAPNTPSDKRWFRHPRLEDTVRMTSALQAQYSADSDKSIQISTGDEEVSAKELHWLAVRYFGMLPFKFVTSPLLDGLGTPAWDNMSRRTQVMFEGSTIDIPPGSNDPAEILNHPPGAVEYFAGELEKHIGENADRYDYQLTVIGHSMGSMVLNEFLRRHPGLPYENIVYMGAACSVRDFSKSVIPVMVKNPKARFFNLCLHPTAEVRETHGLEFPPRGSLLVWIDDYFANPATPLDRTMGRWENIVESSYVIPDDPAMKRRMTFKAFGLRPTPQLVDDVPQQHGDFRACRYWSPSFWQAEPIAAVQKRITEYADEINRKEQVRRLRSGAPQQKSQRQMTTTQPQPQLEQQKTPVQRYEKPATMPSGA